MTEMELSRYTGVNIPNVLKTENEKQTYHWCMEYMHQNYGDNVEYEHMLNQIYFCPETRDCLYKDPPAPVKYKRGMRPVLDKVVDEVTAGCKTDREKVFAIFVYVRDLYKEFNGADLFFGGTEEDLIKKHEWFCERVARLMVGLCEVAGFPGRIIFHIAAGHLTSEIYFDGKWAYFDPRMGLFYLWEDGRMMSVEEILQNRDRIYQQEQWVYDYHSPYWMIEYRCHRNYHFCFSPYEIECFTPYSLTDADKYHFEWTVHDVAMAKADPAHEKYIEYGAMTLIRSENNKG